MKKSGKGRPVMAILSLAGAFAGIVLLWLAVRIQSGQLNAEFSEGGEADVSEAGDRKGLKIMFSDYLENTVGDVIDLLEEASASERVEDVPSAPSDATPGDETLGGQTPGDETLGGQTPDDETTGSQTPDDETPGSQTPNDETSGGETEEPEPVRFTTSKGFQGEIRDGVTYIDGYLIANKTYSLPADYGNGLTAEMQSAFNRMSAAAKADGLKIYIVSGFRSYSAQKKLYKKYADRDGTEKADTYSARAGHSEHQSGLAADVNSVKNSFAGTPEGIWLASHCYEYGFIIRYPQGKTDETGYKYEPWHIRYVGKELAAKLYNGGDWITMEDYFGITSKYQQ